MYQQELGHLGRPGGMSFGPVAAWVKSAARHKRSLLAWALVATLTVAGVITQSYSQTMAPAATSQIPALRANPDAVSAGPSRSATIPEALGIPTPVAAPPVSAVAAQPVVPVVPAPAPAPVPAPPPAPAPPADPDSNIYTVVAGDTVGAIAARFGVDMNAMLAANGLGPSSVIVPEQTLKLTGPPLAPVSTPAAPTPAAASDPIPGSAPSRTINVAGSGGQAMVDRCIGPIHFTPTDAYTLFIVEHDFCGGWAEFSGIGIGETVNIPGYGTYKVAGRGQVPLGGTTNNVAAVFGGFPRAVLQTCIPGTSQMLVIGLN